MDHKNGHISKNIQRQKLSIAVFEPASWDPSHERLDQTVFFIKKTQKKENYPPSRDFGEVGTVKPETPPPSYILDIYIYIDREL